MSATTVARLNERWNEELAKWRDRRLDEHEVVYVWVDGVYVKAGLEREKAAILVVIGALSDGTKTVLSVVPGYRESTESWSDMLRDLRDRGMNCPKLVVGDGHLGIWGALRNVYPDAAEQRCWNHKIINVLDKLPKRQQEQAKLMLRSIPYAGSRAESERLRSVFCGWCRERSYDGAAESLERDWGRMVTFYDFPAERWKHVRTTNVVESPFAALRLRTDAAKRFKRVDRAIAVIWKMLLVAESRFRRLKAPELMRDVYLGAVYKDGIVVDQHQRRLPPDHVYTHIDVTSGKGRYLDNIFVERLWRSVKCEEVYLKAYRNGSEARRGIDAYLDLYNREGPHQSLGYRTPAQVFAEGRPLRCLPEQASTLSSRKPTSDFPAGVSLNLAYSLS